MTQRREFLLASAAASMAAIGLPAAVSARDPGLADTGDIRFALNTSTVRGQKLSITEQIDLAAEAGYDGIEPWIGDLRKFLDNGGKTMELRKRLEDRGLQVVSAIGFAKWIVDDEKARREGLDEARRDMELIREIGGGRIAAPPTGAHRAGGDSPSLPEIADRYRALCDVGQQQGVSPQLELWGFSPTLSKLAELAYVATAAAHPMACVLPDFYHIYKGGNDFTSLSMIEASKMQCFHINDYPGQPGIDQISDKDRVFPGDGVCDLPGIIAMLVRNGFRGVFSLELFNPDYWNREPSVVASEGLLKSRAVVTEAFAKI